MTGLHRYLPNCQIKKWLPAASSLPNGCWIATLSESEKQRLSETAREIHHAGRDYMQFLATTYYLHQTRSEPFAALMDIACRKAAPLLVRFEGITDNEWTEAELDQWLDSLDEFSLAAEQAIELFNVSPAPCSPRTLFKFRDRLIAFQVVQSENRDLECCHAALIECR
ncbi:MAG: hypothetical protein ACQESR_26445 [Planctomycetota bacterium]